MPSSPPGLLQKMLLLSDSAMCLDLGFKNVLPGFPRFIQTRRIALPFCSSAVFQVLTVCCSECHNAAERSVSLKRRPVNSDLSRSPFLLRWFFASGAVHGSLATLHHAGESLSSPAHAHFPPSPSGNAANANSGSLSQLHGPGSPTTQLHSGVMNFSLAPNSHSQLSSPPHVGASRGSFSSPTNAHGLSMINLHQIGGERMRVRVSY